MQRKVSILITQHVIFAMILANAYCALFRLKEAKVLALFIGYLQYQAKKARQEINPRTVVPADHHDFFKVFSHKVLDTLLPHQNYDHKIL